MLFLQLLFGLCLNTLSAEMCSPIMGQLVLVQGQGAPSKMSLEMCLGQHWPELKHLERRSGGHCKVFTTGIIFQ